MYLTETHIINKKHQFYKEIDNLCFLSKNLYNAANYIVRQEFINSSKNKEAGLVDHANYLNFYDINKLFISNKKEEYISLPRKVSNQTLINLDKNWKSFFASIKDWGKNPNKYKGKPNLPRYLDKEQGRYIISYELGSISKRELKKNNIVKLSGTNIRIPFMNNKEVLKYVRIVPLKCRIYKIEIIYDKKEENLGLDTDNILGIDIGVNNLMALTSNKIGFKPILINGRDIKSINQYYNKKKSTLQSKLDNDCYSSEEIERLTHKRNMKINDRIHKATKMVVDICISNNIGKVVIGYNKGWKSGVEIGKRNNQIFVNIPFRKMIDILSYKLRMIGVDLIEVNESYTSKCSFLDLEEIKKHEEYKGKREKRGLYISGKYGKINSDINGSYNILRKVFPKAISDGIEGLAVHPILIKINK